MFPSKRRVPKRLKRDPILSAMSELRFRGGTTGGAGASAVLPGMLYAALRAKYPRLEQSGMPPLPMPLLNAAPGLRFAQVRLGGTGKSIAIGDSFITVGVDRPYPGWEVWKSDIQEVWRVLQESQAVGPIEAITVKYVNLLEAPLGQDHLKYIDGGIALGGHKFNSEPMHLRTEVRRNDGTAAIIQLISQATATQQEGRGPQMTGLIVDIDVVMPCDAVQFWPRASELLEDAHAFEKQVFYDIVDEELIRSYGPEY